MNKSNNSLNTFVIVIVMLCLFPISANGGSSFLACSNLKMKVVNVKGEKIIDTLVTYSIYKFKNEWSVVWDQISFFESGGIVRPTVEHYSTAEGTIRNVKVNEYFASFEIVKMSANITVTCRPSEKYKYTPDVRVIAVYPEGTKEWVITENIVLNGNIIGGVPATRENKILFK